MRDADAYSEALFSSFRLEDFVPVEHPLRPIRQWVNGAPAKRDVEFPEVCATDVKGSRPNTAREKVMRTKLMQALCRVPSEQQIVEQIQHYLLFHWLVSVAIGDAVWNHSVFCTNRD